MQKPYFDWFMGVLEKYKKYAKFLILNLHLKPLGHLSSDFIGF